MCDHPNREAAMATVLMNDAGKPTVWCDPCLAPLVLALNHCGLATVASCCGHGRRPGIVTLADGRSLVVASDLEQANQMLAGYPDINAEVTK